MVVINSFLIGLLITINRVYLTEKISDPATRISENLDQLIKTGIKPNSLDKAIESLQTLTDISYQKQQNCKTCQHVVDKIIHHRKSGIQKDEMSKLIKDLCLVFTDWGQEGCSGNIDTAIDSILYILDNKEDLTADRVCAMYLQRSLCKDPRYLNWSIKIPEKISIGADELSEQAPGTNSLKILHLTDIHYDPNYVPGSNAKCGKPCCCQGGEPEKPEDAAGYWGDYNNCDIPWHSVLNLMDQTKEQHPQIDYVYFTGDVIPHDPWAYTKKSNLKNIKQLSDLFLETYGSIPVYPVIGNHEAYPCDFFSPINVSSDVSTQWLYDELAEDWSKWLPEDTKETIRKGAYYTVLAKKGFRIIVLNSIACYTDNLWLVYDDVDPYGQLQWFADTLAEAERNGEAVHILSHIPPGTIECWRSWSDQFNNIVKRFSKTIKAHFNGHTHKDEIRIFLDDTHTKAISVAYNGASFTHFVGNNPNYKIFDVDSENYQILDYDTWIFNLAEANKEKHVPPKWYKLYSFKEAYGLNSTNMDDLFDWIQRMKHDPQRELMKKYDRFYSRDSPVATDCNDSCLDTLLCHITSTDIDDIAKC